MKKLLSSFVLYLLISVLSASSVMCFVTGFDIPVTTAMIIISAALFSLFFCIISLYKHPVIIAILASLPAIFYSVTHWRDLYNGICCIISALCKRFPFLNIDLTPETPNATALMLLITAVISIIVCLCVSSRSSLLLALISVLVLVIPCIIIPDSMPDTLPFTAFTVSVILLVMTEYHSLENAGKAVFMLSIPVIALVFLILLIFPPASFTAPSFAENIKQNIMTAVDGFFFPTADSDDSIHTLDKGGLYVPETNDLSAAGPRTLSDAPVMGVYSTQTGQTYLRGVAYGDYVNNSWLPASEGNFASLELDFEPLTQSSGAASDYITIQQYKDSNCVYTPYYLSKLPTIGTAVADAYISCDSARNSYTSTFSASPVYDNGKDNKKTYEDYVYQNYLSVPEPIKEYVMDNIWDGFFDSMTITQKCAAVTDHLAATAVYDLDTPPVPDDTEFVLWFLEHEKRGYCVHFATAATLMLRSIGIPARYVSGFCCYTVTDRWRNAAEKNAHAWVEYYVSDCGWLPLEATPPAFIEQTVTEPVEIKEVEKSQSDEDDEISAAERPTSITVSEAEISLPEPDESTIEAEKEERGKINPFVIVVLCLSILAAIVFIRRAIIWALRKKEMTSGNANLRAIGMWKYITALSKACGIEKDKKCESIALKARFSQHTISDDELRQLEETIDELTNELRQENLFYRTIYRFVLVVL